jgi:DNA-binding protein YbaB
MKEKADPKGHVAFDSDGFIATEKTNMVFSEIPWEDYVDRMIFTGKLLKGSVTASRSVTFEVKELRIAEIICESDKRAFQTVSDVIRDAIKKGLAIDYEILVRRKGKIKLRGEALYRELAHIDEELAIIKDTEMVEERIKAILKDSVKGIAGRGREWAEKEIEKMITAIEKDYPKKGITEYFYKMLRSPRDVTSILRDYEEGRKTNVFT